MNTLNVRPKGARRKQWIFRIVIVSVALFAAMGIGSGIAFGILLARLPDIQLLEKFEPPSATRIYTADGTLITSLSPSGRYERVPLDQIPKHVQNAVISTEDRRFWQHQGVDPIGIARALFKAVTSRQREGGSTLTQQLVKNLLLTPERSLGRKVAEAVLAIQIERHYTKEQLLELYLNNVFLGHNVYGVESAARLYFGKAARELTLGEGAMLAGIIRGPEFYSPYNNPKAAEKLKQIILGQMEKEGVINAPERRHAENTPLKTVGLKYSYPYPYFLDFVLATLRQDFGEAPFRQGGWKVYTTIKPELQRHAEKVLERQLPRLTSLRARQASLISLDPNTGAIQALVGGVSYRQSQFNRAYQAKRQVGSTFKPFVYLAALEKGHRLQETLKDTPVSYGKWRPHNYDHRFRGSVSMIQALSQSLNIPTIRLADEVGLSHVLDVVRRTGITSPVASDLTSVLGASEMSLLELTSAYGVFATNGLYVAPTPLVRVEDAQGQLIREYIPQPVRTFQEAPVSQLNLALQQVVTSGTGQAAQIGRPVAGKTGTTDNYYDAWFVGYVPQLVTGIWVGNDNPSAMAGGGGVMCAPIWRRYMLVATQNLPSQGFNQVSPSPSASPSESASASGSSSAPVVEVSLEPTPTATDSSSPAEIPMPENTPLPTVLPSESAVSAPPADPSPPEGVVEVTPDPLPTQP